jgi:hypothetical protein
MVVIELEPEPEPEVEETTRPSLPPGYVFAPAPTTAAEEADEDAFEDALTDEQLREVAPHPLNPLPFILLLCRGGATEDSAAGLIP